jgi:glutamine synthetase
MDHHTHEDVPHSPRAILKRQVARAEAMGFKPMMATELEFFLFENSFDTLRDGTTRTFRRWAATTSTIRSSARPRKRT